MTTDPIIPAYTLTPGRLREAPLGTVVADRDGDLWLRSTITVTHPDTATFDDLDAFVGRQVLGWGIWACSGRPIVGPVHLRSSASLARVFGDPRGKLRPSTVAEKSLVRSMSPRELVSNMYLGEPEVADDDVKPYAEARTVRLTAKIDDPTGQVEKLLAGGADLGTVSADVSFDEKPGDPDTADHSLDLDDLYRAKPPTIVVDSDGDLWRRQVTREGSKVWVLVVENGVARPRDIPAAASSSRRLIDRFGPIAYAPVEDAKAALALIPRDVECVLGGGDPEDAPADPDDVLDPDAVVERALDRARVALTGDGEHVEVTITRDADGKVRVRTAVTGEVEP